MADDRVEGYAAGLLEVARVEGDPDRVGDELFRIARAVESSAELRDALVDPRVPMQKKLAIIADTVGDRASPVSVSLVSFVVGMGRAGDLPAIADGFIERLAAARDAAVAEVRSAVPLDEDTVARLTEALRHATGKRVEVKVVVDPSVIGGIVTQVGDVVIDGSVQSRLRSLRQSLETRG